MNATNDSFYHLHNNRFKSREDDWNSIWTGFDRLYSISLNNIWINFGLS
jgi:hypothetical protein